MRARLRTLLVWAAVAVALVAFVLLGLAGSNSHNGHLAPPLPSQRLSGSPITLQELRGHPAIVTFWASWCGPCAQEAPALQRFSEGLHHRGALVGVNWEDPSVSEARSFVKRYHWSFPNLRDPSGAVGRDYGVTTGLPTTVALDSAGRVLATLRGPQTQQTLERALATASG
jgi:cytochrome c biogenesis protein CcmG, thiol:disulfide interchange protein DsbE